MGVARGEASLSVSVTVARLVASVGLAGADPVWRRARSGASVLRRQLLVMLGLAARVNQADLSRCLGLDKETLIVIRRRAEAEIAAASGGDPSGAARAWAYLRRLAMGAELDGAVVASDDAGVQRAWAACLAEAGRPAASGSAPDGRAQAGSKASGRGGGKRPGGKARAKKKAGKAKAARARARRR